MDPFQAPGYDPQLHVPTLVVDDKGAVVRIEATPLGEGQLSAAEILGESPPQEVVDRQWKAVREHRNRLLTACDWVLARAFETGQPVPAGWLEYRRSLRDITKQANPFQIVWPAEPGAPGPEQA